MEPRFKPDLEEARNRWTAVWNMEIIGRPCVAVTAPKEGVRRQAGPPGPFLPDTDFDAILDRA